MRTRMSGAFEYYLKMFKQIMFWHTGQVSSHYYQNGTHKVLGNEDGHYLYDLGWAVSEMGYHGWEDNAAKNEMDIYNKVETAYCYLLKSLAEAIGFEYTDEDVWKYHLKDIDTNDMLALYEKYKK